MANPVVNCIRNTITTFNSDDVIATLVNTLYFTATFPISLFSSSLLLLSFELPLALEFESELDLEYIGLTNSNNKNN